MDPAHMIQRLGKRWPKNVPKIEVVSPTGGYRAQTVDGQPPHAGTMHSQSVPPPVMPPAQPAKVSHL
jgi:hypothetical protein